MSGRKKIKVKIVGRVKIRLIEVYKEKDKVVRINVKEDKRGWIVEKVERVYKVVENWR